MAESHLNTKEIPPEKLKAKRLTSKVPNSSLKREMMLTLRIVLQKSWIRRLKSFTLRCVILSCQ